MDRMNYMITGIGINISSPIKPELKDIATSLKKESDGDILKVSFLKSILVKFR